MGGGMRRILHLWMALAMICLSAGPVSLAWAQPGTGNDVGQGNGHGQGMLTAPGQTGVQTNQSQTQVQPTGNGSNNSNGNGTGASNAHGNNPNASDNAAQAQGNGKSNATPPGDNGKGNTTSSAGNDNGVTGNSGTIKISPSPLSSSSMANHPHPGCTFFILGFDFPTQSGTYWITPQPTNGNGPAGSTTSRTTPIAYANGATSPYAVLVQSTERPNGKGSDIQIGPITDFASGQYKVHVNSDATPGGAKQKVFRLDC